MHTVTGHEPHKTCGPILKRNLENFTQNLEELKEKYWKFGNNIPLEYIEKLIEGVYIRNYKVYNNNACHIGK